MRKHYPLWSLRRPVRDKKWVWAGLLFAALIASMAIGAASDGDDPPTCNTPADAVTAAEVTGWRNQYTHAAHVKQWNRVLEALGEDTGSGVTAMTSGQALLKYQQFQNTRWDRTYRTLKAVEDCETATTTTSTTTTTTTMTAAAQQALVPWTNGAGFVHEGSGGAIEGGRVGLQAFVRRISHTNVPQPGQPVRVVYRTCGWSGNRENHCEPTTWGEPALDSEWKVPGLEPCPDDDTTMCLFPPDSGWTKQGGTYHFTTVFTHTDDNAVGHEYRRWEFCPAEDANRAELCADLYIDEDDLLQVGLRAHGHDGNDYRKVDLTVGRDHVGGFWIELRAEGAARLGDITANGAPRTASGNATGKQLQYRNGAEGSRDAVRTAAISCDGNETGWIEARGGSGTRATTDRVQVCYPGAPNPNAGQKISGHATATFPLRMACLTWSDTNGGASRSVHSELRNAGWEILWVEPRVPIATPGFPPHDAAHPRPCNVDFVTIWSLLGPQTAQVKCTVGESVTAALDDGTYTDSGVMDRVRDHIAPAYRAGCLQS